MMKDMVGFLLNRGQAIDPTVGSIEASMDAIDSVLKTATTKRCGACKVSWTAPVTVCPECGDDSRVISAPMERNSAQVEAHIEAFLGAHCHFIPGTTHAKIFETALRRLLTDCESSGARR